jgi:hypothetical protein
MVQNKTRRGKKVKSKTLKDRIVADMLKLENMYINERNTDRLNDIRKAIDLIDR